MRQAKQLDHKITKSYVRIVVTYFVVFCYTVAAIGISIYLFRIGENELALSVFNGLATLAAGIAGFWFGSRGAGFPDGDDAGSGRAGDDDVFIGPELGQRKSAAVGNPDADTSPPIGNE
ncbi:MAG: hypothetical protein AAF601_11705 [Pseudomonadota bacterium]